MQRIDLSPEMEKKIDEVCVSFFCWQHKMGVVMFVVISWRTHTHTWPALLYLLLFVSFMVSRRRRNHINPNLTLLKLASDPDIFGKMALSIAPEIYGHEVMNNEYIE